MKGTGFVEGMTIVLGPSPVLDPFVADPSTLLFLTPPQAPGFVDLVVQRPIEYAEPPVVFEAAFKYEADVQVGGVEPVEGPTEGGTPLTVVGKGFGPGALLFVGGRMALATEVVDGGTLTALSPPGTYGAADVHVVAAGKTAVLEDGFAFREEPRIDGVAPVLGPAAGGTLVRILGRGLHDQAEVEFGLVPAWPLDAATDGTWLDVAAPAGPPGEVADVTVTTSWGEAVAGDAWAWIDPAADPYVLACTHAFPSSGAAAGGDLVRLACAGTWYGVEVRFGSALAEVVELVPAQGILSVLSPPGEPGPVAITVTSPYAAVGLPAPFVYDPPPSLAVTSVSPSEGPLEGGTVVTISGEGFAAGAEVRFGALAAAAVEVEGPGTLVATSPPGVPGAVDLAVASAGEEILVEDAFVYTSGQLALHLVTPSVFAIPGGTYLEVHGDGFGPETEVSIGGEPCEVIALVSPAELHVRSPRLPIGVHDARAATATAEALAAGAVTAFDPRSGYGGTWGGPVDGAVNVTVRGAQAQGDLPGAFVLVRTLAGAQISGTSNEAGQVTLSEPWLGGPVVVTAAVAGYTAYSIADFDAKNATIYLKSLSPPPAGAAPPPGEPLPDAVLRGKVLQLGKYVVPPPGSCQQSMLPGQDHCHLCVEDKDCDGEGFACVDLLEEGKRCLEACAGTPDCPQGYACALQAGETRCIPSPGEVWARCGVAPTSLFAQDLYVPPTGWVQPGQTYELPSGRLGELAIVCFGGWKDVYGNFTPTVLGVRRHVFASSGDVLEGLDVPLEHKLDTTFRLRLQDPPAWPDGLQPPYVLLSLDLGPDGAIPFSRTLVPADDDVWLAPRQLAALTGELYDADYFFYTSLSAVSPDGYPTTYNLLSDVPAVGEYRLPVWEDGVWTLDTSLDERDVHAMWGTASDRAFAVGDGGLVLLWNGVSWNAQSVGTSHDLRAVSGRGPNDVWVAGLEGTLLRWDGLSWSDEHPPEDDYRAVATAPGEPVFLAGQVRLRRVDPDGDVVLEGPPWVQDVYGLHASGDGRLAAAGAGGRVLLRDAGGEWTSLPSPTDRDLRAVHLDPGTGEVVAAGDGGTLLAGDVATGLSLVPLPPEVSEDLFAVARSPNGDLHVVGDFGRAIHRLSGTWAVESIPDYRTRARAVFSPPDGGPVRVAGETTFVLGPLLHFPVVTGILAPGPGAPGVPGAVGAAFGPGVTLGYTWDGGPAAQFTQVTLFEEVGPDLWTAIVDGKDRALTFPDLTQLAGHPGHGHGTRRVDLLRVLNPDFDIDLYTTRDFSIFKRRSWASNRGTVAIP